MRLAIDIETFGLDPQNADMVEVAFCWQKPNSHYQVVRIVNCTLDIIGNLVAIRMHQELINEIIERSRGLEFSPNKLWHTSPWLMKSFNDDILGDRQTNLKEYWINDWTNLEVCLFDANFPIGDSLVAIGKNLQFDLGFLAFNKALSEIYVHHRRIDLGCLFLKPDDEVPPDFAECCKRSFNTTINLPDISKQHTAVWDAIMSYRLFERWQHERRQAAHASRPSGPNV